MTDSELAMIEFRQHATDIPALVAEIRRLEAEVERILKAIDLLNSIQIEMPLPTRAEAGAQPLPGFEL